MRRKEILDFFMLTMKILDMNEISSGELLHIKCDFVFIFDVMMT